MKPFSCECCGECCRGDMKVFLNPDDLVLMARYLNLNNTQKLFDEKYVLIDYSRNNAPLPRIRFSKGPAGCCPFLENRLIETGSGAGPDTAVLKGLCRLHPDFKPMVCHLAPLYRIVDTASGVESWGRRIPLPGCPGYSDAWDYEDISDKDFAPPEELRTRLSAEKKFFIKMTEMLESGKKKQEIIDEFYCLDIE